MNKSAILLFGKAQISAFSGGVTDYFLMIILTEVFNIHYTLSILLSGSFGALINFSINRGWAFKTDESYSFSIQKQLLKFILVVLGSIFFKSAGTYQLSNLTGINYKIGRILTDLVVSYSFNFPLIKYWVFKKDNSVKEEQLLFI